MALQASKPRSRARGLGRGAREREDTHAASTHDPEQKGNWPCVEGAQKEELGLAVVKILIALRGWAPHDSMTS